MRVWFARDFVLPLRELTEADGEIKDEDLDFFNLFLVCFHLNWSSSIDLEIGSSILFDCWLPNEADGTIFSNFLNVLPALASITTRTFSSSFTNHKENLFTSVFSNAKPSVYHLESCFFFLRPDDEEEEEDDVEDENEEDDSPNSLALKEVDNVIASTNVVSSWTNNVFQSCNVVLRKWRSSDTKWPKVK